MSNLRTVRNVNGALRDLLWAVRTEGVEESSRNGPVLRLPGVTVVTYTRPWERVLSSPVRDANPFFHLFEALWMLAGANDLRFVEQFAKSMKNYSDDGKTLRGAYGYRWRKHWAYDQVNAVIAVLRDDKSSRRGIVNMWDPSVDLPSVAFGALDVPCNLTCTVQIRADKVELTVFNRSNDILWGLAGSNAVHFTLLQEYIANALGLGMGEFTQISVNAHLYLNEQGKRLMAETDTPDYYEGFGRAYYPLFTGERGQTMFDEENKRFVTTVWSMNYVYRNLFLAGVAAPMRELWLAHKASQDATSLAELASYITQEDWRAACLEWITRRTV